MKLLLKQDEEFRDLLMILAAMLVTGTVFYSLVEDWSLIDSIYFCIITIATIGYGDLHPTTGFSKIFTIFYALGGIGIFVGIVTRIASGLARERAGKKTKPGG